MNKTHSVGAILINPLGKIAVVSNRGRSWTLPKGHVEANETQLNALYREIWEETGIKDVLSIKEFNTYERPRTSYDSVEDAPEIKVITMYLCLTDEVTLSPQDPENPDARWLDPDEVESLLTHKIDIEFYNSVKSEVKGIASIKRPLLLQALDEMEDNQQTAAENPKKEEEFQAEFMYSNPNDYGEMAKLYSYYGYKYSRGLWELWQVRFNLALEAEAKRLAKD